jgi:uncharacterized membrane protein
VVVIVVVIVAIVLLAIGIKEAFIPMLVGVLPGLYFEVKRRKNYRIPGSKTLTFF